MKRYFHVFLYIVSISAATGQEKKSALDSNDVKVNYEAYVDFHYVNDFNRLTDNVRPFNSNPMFVNQFGLAYAYMQADIEYKKFFARGSFHTGEIVRLMYADEDYLIKFIRELSLTYKLNDKVEFQGGLFPAIFGSETFINKDNLHATRATMTDFAPDFETGMRVKYRLGKHWQGTAQITNGWQTIRENNHSPAFGVVHVYDKPDKFMFNYGIFLGNEVYKSKGALDQLKFYNNIFSRIYLGKWILAPMVDIGMIQNPVTKKMDHWQSFGGSVRYALSKQWGVAVRYERMRDPNSVFSELLSPYLMNGFQLKGSTVTLEYLPAREMTLRLEGRYNSLAQAAYQLENGNLVNNDFFIMFSVALKLKHQSFFEKYEEPYLKSQFY